MAVMPGLLEIHILQIFNHALREDEQRRKHQCCQYNSENGNKIPGFVRLKAVAGQSANDGFMLFHDITALHMDFSIFNTDGAVSLFRNLWVMGYHYDGLMEFLAGDF